MTMGNKNFKWWLIAFLLLFIFSPIVAAQINATTIKVDESEFTLNGITGDELKATMHIKEAGGEMGIHETKIYSIDLVDDKTMRRITSDQLIFDKNDFNISKKGFANVTFFITGNLNPGSYKGEIFITSENSEEKEIPVTVNIKDATIFPLTIIFFGLLASLLLTKSSNYIKDKKKKDAISESINNLRSGLESHKKELGEKYLEINEKVNDAYSFLKSERLDDADKKINEARDAFIAFDFGAANRKKMELEKKVQKIESYIKRFISMIEYDDVLYIETILEEAKNFLSGDNTADAEAKLVKAEDRMSHIDLSVTGQRKEKALKEIEELNRKLKAYESKLDQNTKKEIEDNIKNIGIDLNKVPPHIKNGEIEINAIRPRLEDAIKPEVAPSVKPEISVYSPLTLGVPQYMMSEGAEETKKTEIPETKTKKVGLFGLIKEHPKILTLAIEVIQYGVVLAIAALTGIQALYATDISYGAKGFIDYSAAFLWGFGADQAKERVMNIIKS